MFPIASIYLKSIRKGMLLMDIRIAGTANDSIVDGPGIRFTIFTQGCPHHCEGCHNPQTHDFNGGSVTDTDELVKMILSNPLLDGVTFSGGEPFCQAKELYSIAKKIEEKKLSVMTYTGYTFEYLVSHANSENYYRELLEATDYLVDGRFELDKKSYLLVFKGSSNQRILDCKRSLAENTAVEIEL